MDDEHICISRVPGTNQRVVVRLRDNAQDVVDGVRSGSLPGEHQGWPIELVELTITSTVTRPSEATNVERPIALRREPTGMELIVLAIQILTG